MSLFSIQEDKIFLNNQESIFDRYSGLIASVGSKTYEARIRSEASEILLEQATDYQSSKSGVNLDEEAANLMRFKQSYQAAGQLLNVASEMMDVLFAALR